MRLRLRDGQSWHEKAIELDVLVREKDREIERLNGRVEELLRLVEDLSKPAWARRSEGPAGTTFIGSRSPKTRASIIGTALLILIAVTAILIIAPWVTEVPRRKAPASTAAVCDPLRSLTRTLTSRFGVVVTSTTGGRHAPGSYHYRGQAVDLGGSATGMYRASAYILASGRYRGLIEGIHNPNLSVKYGRRVSYHYWGLGTWGQHANHIHLAGCGRQLALGGAVSYGDRLPLSVRRRSRGRNVRTAQKRLRRIYPRLVRRRGYRLTVDGRYGKRTAYYVRRFQRKHPRLRGDGVVGWRTWHAIRRAA